MLVDIAVGGVSGAFGGSALGKVGMRIANVGVEFAGSIASDLVAGKPINWLAAGMSAGFGLLFSDAGAQHDGVGLRKKSLNNIKKSKEKFKSGKFTAEQFAQSQKALKNVLKNRTKALKDSALRGIYEGIYPNIIQEIIGIIF